MLQTQLSKSAKTPYGRGDHQIQISVRLISIHDSQDHRIVVVKCKISLQSPKSLPSKKLNWQGLSDPDVANKINRAISENG